MMGTGTVHRAYFTNQADTHGGMYGPDYRWFFVLCLPRHALTDSFAAYEFTKEVPPRSPLINPRKQKFVRSERSGKYLKKFKVQTSTHAREVLQSILYCTDVLKSSITRFISAVMSVENTWQQW